MINSLKFLFLKDYVNRERPRVPMPPLPPPRPEINNRMYNSLMHDMIRSTERLGIPVHERLALNRVPVVEDRRKIRRRSKITLIYHVWLFIYYVLCHLFRGSQK